MRKKFASNSDLDFLASSIISIDGKDNLLKTEEGVVLLLLKELEQTCASLVKSKEVIFHCEDGKQLTCGDAGKRFLEVIQNEMLERVELIYPECRFNPFVKVSLDAIAAADARSRIRVLKAHEDFGKVEPMVEMLNRLVDDIRRGMGSEELRKVFKSHQRSAIENKRESSRLVDGIFRRYAKVLVVRLDLSYKKTSTLPLDQQNISPLDARRDMRCLLKEMRGKLFKENFISYIWKLEYGPMRGYHYHVFFFFDGSKVMRDIDLAMKIGEHWSTVVTEGRGAYFNCNAIKKHYPFPAIGMIDHRDSGKIDNLKSKALDYLMKVDYYIRPMADKKMRTFSKGGMPKPVATNRGRPRGESPIKFGLPSRMAAPIL